MVIVICEKHCRIGRCMARLLSWVVECKWDMELCVIRRRWCIYQRLAGKSSTVSVCNRLTLCLSTCNSRRFGSNSSLLGSRLTGLCLRPLLHRDHSGLIRPQNAGPVTNRTVYVKSTLFPVRLTKSLIITPAPNPSFDRGECNNFFKLGIKSSSFKLPWQIYSELVNYFSK